MDGKFVEFSNVLKQEQEDRKKSFDELYFQMSLKEKAYIDQEKLRAYII